MYIDTKLERQPSGHDGHYISWAFCCCLWDHSAPSRTDVASYLATSALVAVEAWRQTWFACPTVKILQAFQQWNMWPPDDQVARWKPMN